MKIKAFISILLTCCMLVCCAGCGSKTTKDDTMPDPVIPSSNTEKTTETEAPVIPQNNTDIPDPYFETMQTLISQWGIRKGSMSDPLIGTRILMYEKTKDEVGFLLIDLDGDGVEELITAPFDSFGSNAMVYDILTIKDGQVFHLANSLQATYHLMADNSFILRIPADDGSFTFKQVTVNGSERPTEKDITKEDAQKCYISTAALTPFSSLESDGQ